MQGGGLGFSGPPRGNISLPPPLRFCSWWGHSPSWAGRSWLSIYYVLLIFTFSVGGAVIFIFVCDFLALVIFSVFGFLCSVLIVQVLAGYLVFSLPLAWVWRSSVAWVLVSWVEGGLIFLLIVLVVVWEVLAFLFSFCLFSYWFMSCRCGIGVGFFLFLVLDWLVRCNLDL